MKLPTVPPQVWASLLGLAAVLVVYERFFRPEPFELPPAVQVALDSAKVRQLRADHFEDSVTRAANVAKAAQDAAVARAQAAERRSARAQASADSLLAEARRMETARTSPPDTASAAIIATLHQALDERTAEAASLRVALVAKDAAIVAAEARVDAMRAGRDSAVSRNHQTDAINDDLKAALAKKGACHVVPHLVGCPTRIETLAIGLAAGGLGALALSR